MISYSNRIFFYGPVGLLLALMAGICTLWWVEADRLNAALDAANGHEVAPGIVFAFAEKSVGGFPYRLDLVLSGVTLAHRGADGETAWRSEKVAMHALTYLRGQYIFEAAGLQSIERPGIPGGPPQVTYLTAAIARASAIMRNGSLARFDLDLWQPQAKDASLGADINRTFVAARAQFHLLQRPDNTIDVALKIEGATIGPAFKPTLGPALALFDLRGKLNQAQALAALAAGHQSIFDATEQWCMMGGQLNVEKLDLDWGGVKTTMTGSIGLDANHQLNGTVNGAFDPGTLVTALTHGALNLSGQGKATLSLVFKDGGIQIGANSLGLGTLH